jgi:hypothetical protein
MPKKELLKQAKAAGVAPDAATEDDYTVDELRVLLNPGDAPAWKGSRSDWPFPPAADGYDPAADRGDRLPPTGKG